MTQNDKPPSTQSTRFQIPPLTLEEEDNIIIARITNDERPLRRVLKRFHGYASVARSSPGTSDTTKVEDAREAFLVELASYQLGLKKSAMVCEAETRQADEYRRERQRIEQEHEVLRTQIEELKMALDHAQMLRRRKIEYDQVTERVNTLPPRDELESEISALENDMAAIRAEHETQNRTMHMQKAALDSIVTQLSSLRFIGKDKDSGSNPNSPGETPTLDLPEVPMESTNPESQSTNSDVKDVADNAEASKTLSEEGAVEDDIEMGEVEEEPPRPIYPKKKAREEELEEGEASDESSELSEPPDD